MNERPLVSVLDDDEIFRREVRHLLGSDYEIETFGEIGAFFRSLESREPDLLLLDLVLKEGEDGIEVFRRLREEGHAFPVILLTIYAGTRTTARALVEGLPYLNKDADLDPRTFRSEVGRVIERSLLTAEVEHYRALLDVEPADSTCPWPDTAYGRALREKLAPFQTGDRPLLLAGELGTGKLTSARWVHVSSPRKGAPFLSVTARGRDPEDFERELYGVESAGEASSPGALAAAARGTVFIQGLEAMAEPALERLRLAVASRTYSRQGSRRVLRLTARIIASRLIDPQGSLPQWTPSLEAFWTPQTVTLEPVRSWGEPLEPYLRSLAAREGFPGEAGLGALRPGDLERLAPEGFPRNFHDLRAIVLWGIEALEDAPDPPAVLRLDRLATLPWTAAQAEFEKAYLLAVAERLGRDVEAWRRHTGYSRASIYRWFKFLEE